MTNFEKNIHNAGNDVRLTGAEKARMLSVLSEYMAHKPLRTHTAARPHSPFSWVTFAHRPIAAALVLVLVFGSGVSYAAENSLPGDALYAVKTAVNEPVRVALATNAEAKAEVQIELAERRIEEAATLAAEGRLDDATQDRLAASFKTYAGAAASSIQEADSDDSAASVELAARFENRLIAHESVLAEVEMETVTEENLNHSTRLSDAIRATNMALAEVRFNRTNALAVNTAVHVDASARNAATSVAMDVAAEPAAISMSMKAVPETDMAMQAYGAAEVVPTAPAPDAKTISRMKDAAEKGLKNAQKTLRGAKSLSADARARAEADIELAGTLLKDGKAFLADDLDADAYVSFEESARLSEQTIVFIKAAPTLEKARSRSNRNSRVNVLPSVSVDINTASTVMTTVESNLTLPTDSPTKTDERESDRDQNDDKDDSSNDSRSFNILKFNISL